MMRQANGHGRHGPIDTRLEATALEELLRFHSPVEVSTERFAREPIEIAGVAIPQGALVYGLIASANRDETQFDDPDRLDLGRQKNRHLAFGQGIHYCLGAPWRGWKARSRCAGSSSACRVCGWRCPSPRCAGERG